MDTKGAEGREQRAAVPPTVSGPPRFSVVIPTCRRPAALALCLARLAPGVQRLAATDFEVIVTDDGDDEAAKALIAQCFPWARWTAGPRRGPAANRNHGASLAVGHWLAFTDDDCIPAENWLQALAAAAETVPPPVAIEGAILPQGDAAGDLMECPVNEAGGNFWSANIAVRRDVFARVDGFDANYEGAAHEDQDLYLRLQRLGPIPFVREALVLHPPRRVTLLAEVARINRRLTLWSYHAVKHQRGGLAGAWWFATQVHARHTFREIRRGHPGNATVSFCMLALMPLLLPWHYQRQQRRYRAVTSSA
jgi:GT2 family glycosyltransferase